MLAGNRYTVNRESPGGTYSYNPANGVVTFKEGGFGSFYGVYYPNGTAPYVEVYAAYSDPPIEYGDYYGQCGWLSGPLAVRVTRPRSARGRAATHALQ